MVLVILVFLITHYIIIVVTYVILIFAKHASKTEFAVYVFLIM
jgi:hypothetical protein